MTTSIRMMSWVSVSLAVTLVASPAEGQTPTVPDTLRLTLAEAQRIALDANPAFLADAQEVAISQGALRQARLLFNPEGEVELPGAFSGGALDRYEAQVSQEIEWAGQRGLRVDAAELGVRRAERDVAQARRELLADVARAYYATMAARRRADVAAEVQALNERLATAVRIQADEGEISVLEANLASIEVGRTRARLLSARRQAATAELGLVRLLGIAPGAPIVLPAPDTLAPPPLMLDPDSLVAAALAARSDLAARRAEAQQADVLARLARREAIPNVRVGGIAAQEEGSGSPEFGVVVSLPLPLWNRNQGLIEQREAEARRAELAVEAAELRVRTEVMNAWRRYVTAREEAALLRAQVLGPAHANQELLTIAYEAGRIDLSTLVLLRNELTEAELDYWDAWFGLNEAHTDLQAATGSLAIDDDNEGSR